MSNPLRVLIVEDSQDDTWLIVRNLQRAGFRPDFERVETMAAMREALETQSWDLIISDYSMPQFAGPAALALYRQKGLDIPFISVSGVIGEETAVEMMKAGAHDFVATSEGGALKGNANRFDFILDTISAPHDYNAYLSLLRRNGTMVVVGIPTDPTPVAAGALIRNRRRLAGSGIGGIRETQEMLDFCAAHGIAADVEVIRIEQVNTAWERMLKSDVRYRFVIDIMSLR